jgi:hypothetical protein
MFVEVTLPKLPLKTIQKINNKKTKKIERTTKSLQ